jgi:hypothetical protein
MTEIPGKYKVYFVEVVIVILSYLLIKIINANKPR